MDEERAHVAVVGAGAAGLITGYRLRRREVLLDQSVLLAKNLTMFL